MMNRGLKKELSLLAGLASLGFLMGDKKPWALAFGLAAAGLRLLPSPVYSFEGRSVLITGGSRGLGLGLAEGFLSEGAKVTLVARDADELDRAKTLLQEKTGPGGDGRILTIRCDITQPDALRLAVGEAEARFGRLDVLVNNAGSISVGPFESMEQPDFDAQMTLHLDAAMQAIRFALPAFHRAGGGRVVNISSIGGRIPVPHMAAYCASKFALAGLSETLAAELAPKNIRLTTVYPGLMRTGSPIQAVFKGDHEKEYAWFSAFDVTPGISVSMDYAVRRILDGVRYGDAQVAYPLVTPLGALVHAAFPEIFASINRQAARLYPKGQSLVRKTGADSQDWPEHQLWYKPFKQRLETAESRFNQQEKHDANFNLGV